MRLPAKRRAACLVAVVAVAISGCAAVNAESKPDPNDLMRWSPRPELSEVIPLAGAELMMALDGLQALDLKNKHRTESNPFLGLHPSDGRILGMTGLAMFGVAAAWYAMPHIFRIAVPGGIFVMELGTVIDNRLTYGLTIHL